MTTLQLRTWIPGGQHCSLWIPQGLSVAPDRYLAKHDIQAEPMTSGEATEAWERVVEKVERKVGVDLRNSAASFVWEELHPHAELCDLDFALPETSQERVLLFEQLPTVARKIQSAACTFRDFPLPFLDIYIAPWPRLNWIAMRTHEPDIGPFFLSLK